MEVETRVTITVTAKENSDPGGTIGGLVILIAFVFGPYWVNSQFRDEQNLRVLEVAIGMTISSFTLTYIWFFIIFLVILGAYLNDPIYPFWMYFLVIPFLSCNEKYFITVQFIMTFLLLLCASDEKKQYYYTTAKLVPCFSFTFYYFFEHIPFFLYLTLCSLSVLLCFIHTEYEYSSDCSYC